MSEHKGYKILCIEDEQDFRAELVEELHALGYHAADHGSGEAALAWLDGQARASICCVICDVMLPGLSGLELVGLLRSHPAIAHGAPILLLTALVARDDMLAGLRVGADDYLYKPVDLSVLQLTLENRLRRWGEMTPRPEQGATVLTPALATERLNLSRREIDVLTLIGQGKRNGTIARDLGLSEHTVRQYTKDLYRKLGVSTRVSATHVAISMGLVPHSFSVTGQWSASV